eukprot:scaffold2779_cov376-Prasinococcus_capsulatus_cf.AAC.9
MQGWATWLLTRTAEVACLPWMCWHSLVSSERIIESAVTGQPLQHTSQVSHSQWAGRRPVAYARLLPRCATQAIAGAGLQSRVNLYRACAAQIDKVQPSYRTSAYQGPQLHG